MKLRPVIFFGILIFNAFSGLITTMVVPGLDQAFRIVTIAGDGLMLVMVVPLLLRHRSFVGVKLFIAFAIFALLTIVLTSDKLTIVAQVNGLRVSLFFLSSLLIAYDLMASEWNETFVKLMNAFLIFFALMQTPLSVVQYVSYGAGDLVGGTFGLTGGSGMVTQLLFILVFYFSVQYASLDEGDTFNIKRLVVISLLLAPCAINETKISFLFLGMLIVFFSLSRRRVYKAIPLLALGGMLLYVLNTIYSESVKDASSFLLDEKFYERYLVYDPRPGMDIPRFQKLQIMFSSMRDNPLTFIFGYGYGLFAGKNILGTSAYVRSFWYFAGTRPLLFTVWIQGGLLAAMTIGAACFSFWRRKLNLPSNLSKFRLYFALLLLGMWFYNEALLNRTFAQITSFLMVWIWFAGAEPEVEDAQPEEEEEEAESELVMSGQPGEAGVASPFAGEA